MDARQTEAIVAVLEAGKDLTLATLRPDGFPQATTVGYVSQGLAIYFGCSAKSQKAANLARDDRVSATIGLAYEHWNEIRGLSLGGRARRLTEEGEVGRAGALFLAKFAPEIGQYLSPDGGEMALFEITPRVVSLLDYRLGFGHTELVEIGAPS
ncbi:pyridoxamine 5'-phosphate oxidase family protein [Phenylobacterium sp.]|uniref:pyridoxamine 5'-phosphate oxidase family protein n=1 Tax=Phenylobacterium sp. TaxID=1871053 RepID=UPI003BA8B638